MKTVQCPNCHKFVPNYPAGCQNCGHSLTLLGTLANFDFFQWLFSPLSENSTKFQVILKWVIRVLAIAIAPIVILWGIFLSIAPMLLVAFIVVALYACKVKD